MTSLTRRLLPFVLLLSSVGCSYHLVSPPARVVALESAAPAKAGETIVGARGGVYAAVFDPGAVVTTGGVRRGLGDGIELNAEGTYARVLVDESPHVDRNLYVARAGIKGGNGYVAATGGLGGGFAPAGGSFVAVDVGAIASYPNCYVIPFFSPGVFVSVPVATRTVTFDTGQSSTASTSYGFGLGAGVEIPLSHARCHEGHTAPRLQLGVNAMRIDSTDETVTNSDRTTTNAGPYGAFGWLAGLEFPLN